MKLYKESRLGVQERRTSLVWSVNGCNAVSLSPSSACQHQSRDFPSHHLRLEHYFRIVSFIYLVRRALGNERPWKTECGNVARAVGRERQRKAERCVCVFVCVCVCVCVHAHTCMRVCACERERWSECKTELDRQRQAQAMASTKIAQARISAGNINLSMMSVIKLRRVSTCDINYLHVHVMLRIPLSQLCVCFSACQPVCLSGWPSVSWNILLHYYISAVSDLFTFWHFLC